MILYFFNIKFLKLNYGMFARLIRDQNEYDEFNLKMKHAVLKVVPQEHQKIIEEIFSLCKTRNIIRRNLESGQKGDEIIELSDETWIELEQAGYFTDKAKTHKSGARRLEVDPIVEELIYEKLSEIKDDNSILKMSQLLESFRGRTYMKPISANK